MSRKYIAIGSIVAIVALSIGLFATNAIGTENGAPFGKTTNWPKNVNGVTYGSGLDAVSAEDQPELIQVEATNGKVGYVYRADLEGPEPSSPAAAIALQKANAGKSRTLPVYSQDGVKQIGVFLTDPVPEM